MKIQIKVDKRGNVVDSCFKTFGCGSAIASSSVLTEWVKGRHVDEAINKNEEINKLKKLFIPLSPSNVHSSDCT